MRKNIKKGDNIVIWIVIAIAIVLILYSNTFKTASKEKTEKVFSSPPNTIYVDNQLTTDCFATYSIARRDCSGNDGNAYTTIQKAADDTNPGTNVHVRNGDYKESFIITRGGAAWGYVTFAPYTGESVRITLGKQYTWTKENNLYNLDYSKDLGYADTTTIGLIKNNDFGITRVYSLSDLTNPPIILQNYDLFYFDSASKKIYLRWLGQNSPDNDVYVVEGSKRIFVGAPYVEISGFTIEYGYEGIKTGWLGDINNLNTRGDSIRISNNNIKHVFKNGILSGMDHLFINNNKISYTGAPFHLYSDQIWRTNNQDHAIYVTGVGDVVRNNFVEKCFQICMHLISSRDYNFPKNTEVYNNYIEDGMVMSGTNNKVYNNIIFDYVYVYPSSNTEVYNNIIRLGKPRESYVQFGDMVTRTTMGHVLLGPSETLADGTSGDIVRGLVFKNNIVYSDKSGMCIDTGSTELNSADINNNIYYGCDSFKAAGQIFSSLDSYRNFIKFYNKNLESSSLYRDPKLIEDINPQGLLEDIDLGVDSPAIDTGAIVSLTEDFKGDFRPLDGPDSDTEAQYDIGMLEYGISIPQCGLNSCFASLCKIASCTNSQCSYSNALDGTSCTDNYGCTSDICSNGVCVSSPKTCDDGFDCTIDSCDGLTGGCVFVPDNTKCPSGQICDTKSGCVQAHPGNCYDDIKNQDEVCADIGGRCGASSYQPNGEVWCRDEEDNDCDSFVDDFDPDCNSPFRDSCLSDVDKDGHVSSADFAKIKAYLWRDDCSLANNWCDFADINREGNVSDRDIGLWRLNNGKQCICSVGPELCDGFDNDCDSLVDEGCDCVNLETKLCDNQQGICAGGIHTCSDGKWEICNKLPRLPEFCNGLDDDCDGEIDEEPGCGIIPTNSCLLDISDDPSTTTDDGIIGLGEINKMRTALINGGTCSLANNWCDFADINRDGSVNTIDVYIVVSGYGKQCICSVGPELCDGFDNDCDSLVDEGCDCVNLETKLCDNQQGICAGGIHTCSDGKWEICNKQPQIIELCDQLDNDCDNVVDEEAICRDFPMNSCLLDVDKDGFILNSDIILLNRFVGNGRKCYLANNWCDFADINRDGSVTFVDVAVSSKKDSLLCDCSVGPELCDGFDNDCDSLVDEGGNGLCSIGQQCNEGDGCVTPTCIDEDHDDFDRCGTGDPFDDGKAIDCNDNNPNMKPGATEICDGIDNSCKGVIDDGGNSLCNDGLYCNGAEVCNGAAGCGSGSVPVLNDNIPCTADSCDELNDRIVHTPNDFMCKDGLYCNGFERCDASLGCVAGTTVVCNDGISCTVDSCSEGTSLTDNAGFCNYNTQSCQCTTYTQCNDNNPCTNDVCTTQRTCSNIPQTGTCNDGAFCTVNDACNNGVCTGTQRPLVDDGLLCTVEQCDEVSDSVVHTPSNALCDNRLWCDGAETCDISRGCIVGTAPSLSDNIACTTDSCDEMNDRVVHTPQNNLCSVQGERCDLIQGCILQTCSEQNGFVCGVDMYCPGTAVNAKDSTQCCNVACTRPSGSLCSDCGAGLFNICDRTECESITQRCVFTNNQCIPRTTCVDSDRDEFDGCAPGTSGDDGKARDCNDNNPLEKPGQTWYKDSDNDRYSDGISATQCTRPSGYKTSGELSGISGDCQDNNVNIKPGASEICNGIDDDCIGGVDDGNLCVYSTNTCVVGSCSALGECKYDVSQCTTTGCVDADSDGMLDYSTGCVVGKDICVVRETNIPSSDFTRYLPQGTQYSVNWDTNVGSDPRRLTNLAIISNGLGRIQFSDPLDLVRVRYDNGCFDRINFDVITSMSQNRVELNASLVPNLDNKRATLTFYGVGFRDPKIQRDGVDCTACREISYTNGEYVVEVQDFSVYTAVEGYVDTPPPGGGGGGNTGGGGGGGGGVPIPRRSSQNQSRCVEQWICNAWSRCVNGEQTTTCFDLNKCNTKVSKPLERRACEEAIDLKKNESNVPSVRKMPNIVSILFVVLSMCALVLFIIIWLMHRAKRKENNGWR